MSNLIVGIDPSSIKLAFYALHPNLPTVMPLKYTLGKKYSPGVAAAAMDATLEAVERMTTMSKSATRFAFMEAPVIGRGGARSTIVQAHTSGVVQACLIKSGFTVYMVNQSTWKTWLTGRPNVGKDYVVNAMKGRYPKDHKAAGSDGDVLDAAALARYGWEAARLGSVVAQDGSLST